MAAKLFVASLAYAATDDQLADFFAPCGTVVSAKVIMDRETGRSKGFGFVEMSTEAEAKAAIDQLNGKELLGRPVVVAAAHSRENRSYDPSQRTQVLEEAA